MAQQKKTEDRGTQQQAGWTKTGPAQPLVVEQPENAKGPAKEGQDQPGAEGRRSARADEDTYD
jgi:hypothetical protein